MPAPTATLGYEAPWVEYDSIAERLLCRRCRKTQPISTRKVEGLVSAFTPFLRIHASCMEPGTPSADEPATEDLFEGQDAKKQAATERRAHT